MNLNSSLDYKGNEDAEAGDILIPNILLMQGTSKWVPEDFNIGDLITSVDEDLLASRGETIEIIPFVMKKTWVIFTDEKTPKWVRNEPWNAANDNLPWQFEEEDPEKGIMQLKRQRNYGFYCFVIGDNGIDQFAIPSLINFRSSAGFKPGKKIASHFSTMKSMGFPGFTVSWVIGSENIKDGEKTYQKFTVKKGRNTTEDEGKFIAKWLDLFATQADKIKDHEVEEEMEATGVGNTPPASGQPEMNQQAQF